MIYYSFFISVGSDGVNEVIVISRTAWITLVSGEVSATRETGVVSVAETTPVIGATNEAAIGAICGIPGNVLGHICTIGLVIPDCG